MNVNVKDADNKGISRRKMIAAIGAAGLGALAGSAMLGTQPAYASSVGWINVKDYGAVGDGSTDDTTAIQTAVNACVTAGGGVVYFPTGDYKITAAIQLSGLQLVTNLTGANYITLKGEGENSRIVASGISYMITASGTSNIEGVRFESLSFYSPSRNVSAIDCSKFLRWSVEGCFFIYLTNGIRSTNADSIWICRLQNNRFESCNSYAIDILKGYDFTIADNIIENCWGGIKIGEPNTSQGFAGHTIRIENNVIEGITVNPAIKTSTLLASKLSGNYFEANSGGDIEVHDGPQLGLIIEANSFSPTPTQKSQTPTYYPVKLSLPNGVHVISNFSTYCLIGAVDSGFDTSSCIFYHGNVISTGSTYMDNAVVGNSAKFSHIQASQEFGLSATKGFYRKHSTYGERYITYGPTNPQTTPVTYGSRTWNAGDIVFNYNPAAGGYIGWVCITGGMPGTFKDWGAIQP